MRKEAQSSEPDQHLRGVFNYLDLNTMRFSFLSSLTRYVWSWQDMPWVKDFRRLKSGPMAKARVSWNRCLCQCAARLDGPFWFAIAQQHNFPDYFFLDVDGSDS
jgi:hypothetical protein